MVVSNVELEWEVEGYYVLWGWMFDYDVVWLVIYYIFEVVGVFLNDFYSYVILLIM